MAAVFIGAARMGKDRGYQEGEQQEEGKKSTHKIRSFQGQCTGFRVGKQEEHLSGF